jgi:hypothetical protein
MRGAHVRQSRWESARNETKRQVRWHFTTTNARIKLQRLYPVIEPVGCAGEARLAT